MVNSSAIPANFKKSPRSTMNIEKLAYRPSEAQAALGIKNTAFWALVKDGLLETRKIGAATVVPASSLHAFVANLPKASS